MYNRKAVDEFVTFIQEANGIADKSALIEKVQSSFGLINDGKVFMGKILPSDFVMLERSFGNTVLSLSALQKYDRLPFIICIVTPENFSC